MQDFTIGDLGVFIGTVGGVVTSILIVLQKSRCKSILWGCIERDLEDTTSKNKNTPQDPTKPPETSEKSPLNPNNSDILSNTQNLTTQHLDIVQKATDELVAAAKLNNIKLNTNDTPQNDTTTNDTPQNDTIKTDIENQSINT